MTDTTHSDSEGLPKPSDPPSIRRLGDFELLREIGRGGMGVVYEARQISLGRRVALKVLPPTLGMSPDSAQRFEREARAAAKLHHTNIVPVHGIGQQDGHHFYAMELIEGPSLDQLLADRARERAEPRAGPSAPTQELDQTRTSAGTSGSLASSSSHRNFEGTLSDSSGSSREWFDSVARLVAPVADALAYAHRRGIIHRDIKPGNLILSPEGQLCLTDFGLARMSEEPGMTVTGSFLGTPAYMSPEQIAAGRIELDHRTDIYSLGVVLYEMLTLERPFEGRSRDEMLTSIMTREPKAPRKVNPKIPRDLETICLKAIEKDPARRYATAEAFAADLQQFLAHELIGARRTSPLRRAAKVVRRHPVLAVSVLAAVLLAAVGSIAWQTSRRGELDRLLGEAELALGRGESRVALDRADRVLERDPEFKGGRLIRARALLGIVGRQQEAIAEGEAMIAADPDDWKGHAILVSAAHAGFYGKPLEPHVEAVERLAPQTAEAYTLRALVSESSLEALELLDRALRTDPGYAEALEARATRHFERNDFRAALEDADRLLAARPRSSMGRLLRAVCFFGLHDAASARAAIEEAIRLAPVAENYANRSGLRSITGDAAGAWEDIVTATGLEPNNAGLLLLKAWLAMSAGRLDDALQAASKSVALDPTNPSAYEQLVAIHRARGEHDKIPPILGELDRIAREATEPKFVASVRSARASILLDQGDLDGAVAEANAAVTADPKNPLNYLLRARLVQRRDGFEAMAQDCRHAASFSEDEPGRLFSRAIDLNYHCHMEELALADLDRLAKLTPGWPDAREARGWIHLTAKRYEDALADFEAVAEIAPEWDWIWFRLGSTLFDLHRYEESIRAFERARKLGASDTLDESWARALIALRRDEEALRVADARIERMPGRGSAYVFKGVILARIGRLTEASESITRGIQLEPERDWGPYVARAEVSLFGGLQTCEESLADLDKALKLNPDARSAVALVAGMCLSQRCPALYDSRRFEALAREAVALDPRDGSGHGGLGVVLFEAGRYTEARGELDQVLETRDWSNLVAVISLQYLAMTEWRLGNRLAARDYQKRAAALIDQLAPKDPGFIQIQKRVDALLGTVG